MCSPSSKPVALKWGHLAMSRDILGCHNWRGERVLLVPRGGGGQRCCSAPYNTQRSPHQKGTAQPKRQ